MTLSGHLTPEQLEAEEAQIRALVQQKAAVDPAFGLFLEGWTRLIGIA
jgi:hypothetical protein